jgi:hypothetical protein
MLGSHNSMSYLPPSNLWGKITKRWGKCQDKTIHEQYEAGVRYFDIRVKLVNNHWRFVHNNVDYSYFSYSYLDDILESATKDKNTIYFRILLDERKQPMAWENYANRFRRLVKLFKAYIEDNSYNAVIDSAIIYWDWEDILVHSVAVTEIHASVSASWKEYILGTKAFAEQHNEDSKLSNTNILNAENKVLLLDYIEL